MATSLGISRNVHARYIRLPRIDDDPEDRGFFATLFGLEVDPTIDRARGFEPPVPNSQPDLRWSR